MVPPAPVEGASYLKYELIQKKNTKVLMPVRYSIRNSGIDTKDKQLKKQILNNEVSFLYEPNEMEDLFDMDQSTL